MKLCKKCGENTTPEGKDICWVCEHTPKLHKMDEHFEEKSEKKISKKDR